MGGSWRGWLGEGMEVRGEEGSRGMVDVYRVGGLHI